MNYYGIVDAINIDYGIYGRKDGKKELFKKREKFFEAIKESSLIIAEQKEQKDDNINIFGFIVLLFYLTLFGVEEDQKIIKLIDTSSNPNFKKIIIPNIGLANNYSIADESVLFGLFKNENQFKKLMNTYGGNSNLIIVERDNLPKSLKHFGGKDGIFDYGLYCEHPKNKDILLPLTGVSEKVKTALLEETIRLYQTLGAKEIIIEDIFDIDISNNTNVKNANVGVEVNVRKELLRLKKYGKATFNPEKAFKDLFFVMDYDAIMSVAKGRIDGNQLLEEFTETININIGVDVDVLSLFNNKTDFKYKRKWHFKVEFYDKNDL
jgi:hypothetical protein